MYAKGHVFSKWFEMPTLSYSQFPYISESIYGFSVCFIVLSIHEPIPHYFIYRGFTSEGIRSGGIIIQMMGY